MSEKIGNNPDRLTYSETRTINVGQYENVTSHFTYSSNLRSYNKQDKTVTISHSESASTADFEKDFRYTAKRLLIRVQQVLNTREMELRQASRPFIENEPQLTDKSYVEFDDKELL